jgi:hypothetical protein
VLTAISCVDLGGNDDVDERFYGYFLRDEKAMEEMGLPVYWLGRGFTAGAQTFQGPYGVEFGGEVRGGGISLHYTSWLDGTPGEGTNTSLEITVYGPDAWELVRERIMSPPPPAVPSRYSVTRRTVDVNGRQAQLIAVPSGNRRVNGLSLILDVDSVVVVAQAASVLPGYGASELNIFIKNPDLLVQVMQDLRPYSE